MGSREEAIGLYLLGVAHHGITKSVYDELSDVQKTMVQEKRNAPDSQYVLQPDVRSLFTVALTGGVFDIIHPGHILTLSEAKRQADVLVAVVATDDTVRAKKGREPLHMQEERRELVQALKPVDLAIIGVARWQDTLARVSPDVVVFGHDQQKMDIPGVRTVQLSAQAPNPHSKTSAVREKLGL